MHGEDSVKLFVGSLHARDLNMAAAISKVAAHMQTVRHGCIQAPVRMCRIELYHLHPLRSMLLSSSSWTPGMSCLLCCAFTCF